MLEVAEYSELRKGTWQSEKEQVGMDSLLETLNGVFSLKKCGLGKRREMCEMMKGLKKKKRGGTFSPLDGIALVALLSQSRTAKSRSWAFKQKPGDCF